MITRRTVQDVANHGPNCAVVVGDEFVPSLTVVFSDIHERTYRCWVNRDPIAGTCFCRVHGAHPLRDAAVPDALQFLTQFVDHILQVVARQIAAVTVPEIDELRDMNPGHDAIDDNLVPLAFDRDDDDRRWLG